MAGKLDDSRVVIYCRISSDRDQLEAGVERQEADCRELAKSLGLPKPLVIVDNDVSAYTGKRRPGWEHIVSLIQSGDCTHLLAWHADRLYRRTRELSDLIDVFDAHPVEIHTATSGPIDLGTPSGRMTSRIVGAVSEHESEHKAERIARALRQRAEQGKHSGGGARHWGYEPDGVTLREPEASVLRDAADRILAGDASTVVARHASEQLGRQITQRSLRRSLLAPHMAGLRWHWPARERRAWAARRARGEVSGEFPPDLMSQVIPGDWPGVISLETWHALHDRFRSGQMRARPRRSLLAGILRCAVCEQPLGWGEGADGSSGRRYATYRCVTSSGGCGGVSISAPAVDAWLSTLVRGAYAEHADEVQSRLPAAGEPSAARQRREIERRLDDLASALADGTMDRQRYGTQARRLQEQLAALGPVESLAADRARQRLAAIPVVQRWDQAETAQKREATRAVIDRVWVYPTGRGKSVAPECRAAVVWADDTRRLSLDERRAELPESPADLTDAERRALRNRKDRAKREAARLARERGEEGADQQEQRVRRVAAQREYRARRRAQGSGS